MERPEDEDGYRQLEQGAHVESLSPSPTSSAVAEEAVAEGVVPVKNEKDTVCSELKGLLALALPYFVAMVSWSAMKTTDTSILGHLGTKYLSATAYSDLWTSSTGVFIMGHVLGIFCGQSYGAAEALREKAIAAGKTKQESLKSVARNYALVGEWAQVGFVVLMSIGVIVAGTWAMTGPVLSLFGVESSQRDKAWYFAAVLASCIPARTTASCVSQLFSSQKIMFPSVFAGTCAMLCNLLFGVVLVLGEPFKILKIGFTACPIITSCNEYLQLAIYIAIFNMLCSASWKKYYEDHSSKGTELHMNQVWDGFSWSNITQDRVKQFIDMYLPAALSIGSDFWRLAVIGIFAARMSSDDLAVFNSSYRILWICLTLIGAVASAVGTRLGIALGKGNIDQAKKSSFVGLGLCLLICGLLGVVILLIPRQLGSIFSSDTTVLDRYEDVKFPLAFFAITMNMAVALERVPMAMGRTGEVFVLGLCGSWIGQVPGVILCTTFWRNDLVGLFTGVCCGYGLLCVMFTVLIFNTNWQEYADAAKERSKIRKKSKIELGSRDAEGGLSVICFIYCYLLKAPCVMIFNHGPKYIPCCFPSQKNVSKLEAQSHQNGLLGNRGEHASKDSDQ